MSIFTRIFGQEKRAGTTALSDPYMSQFLSHRGPGAIDTERAANHPTSVACITAISQALASVPLNLYRRAADGGRQKADGEALTGILREAPNDSMTAFEFREAMIASVLTYGQGFARIEIGSGGETTALHHLSARSVSVEQLWGGALRYRVTDARGGSQICRAEEMLHIRYRLAADGVNGHGPVQLAPDAFTLGVRLAEQARISAERMNRIEGAVVFPNHLSGKSSRTLLSAFERKLEQNNSTSRIVVMDGGAEFRPMGFSPRESEFAETKRLSDLAICRAFGVPPTVAGITDNATYSNVEGETKALVTRCLAPMARRIEQAMNAALLPAMARKRFYIEHDLAGLLRGDLKTRYEAYRIGREWGWISPNEIRRLENMAPVDGGDEFLSPLNMTSQGREKKEGEP